MKSIKVQVILLAIALTILNSCDKDAKDNDVTDKTAVIDKDSIDIDSDIDSIDNDLKINPVITWANPADISFGTLLSSTQLNATSDVPGVLVYSPPVGTKLNVSQNQDISVVFTPTDAAKYNTATKTVQINVTPYAQLHDPSFALKFSDTPVNHNMHITSDGKYYYTCNGGNYTLGKINKYTLDGVFITSYDIKIDMRSIMYNKVDGFFYVSGFEDTFVGNIYKIIDISAGTFTKLYPNLYDNYQSGAALSYDCQYLYAFNAGTIKKYKLSDGSLAETITGLNSGSGSYGDAVVAVDPDYIYTWDASTKTVYVYDLTGKYVRSMTLTHGSYGYSLSFVDGLLLVADDAGYATGTWYGYNIRKSDSKNAVVNENFVSARSAKVPDRKDTSN